MDLASKLFKGDRVIWIIFMFLCLVSVIEVFSATSTLAYKNANYWAPILRHVQFLVVGFLGMLILSNIPCKYLSVLSIFLPISIILLVLTPIIGVSENGAERWLNILGFQFQPSELAKLSAIVYVAFLLSRRPSMSDSQIFKWIGIGICITCFIIFLDNLTTAVLLFTVCFLMMFIGQLPIRWLAMSAGAILLAGGFFLIVLMWAPDSVLGYFPERIHTWKARIERHFQPHSEGYEKVGNTYRIEDEKLQEIHAKIAVARGGVLGRMPGHGQERDFLPQAYSDFIYAIIIEELGLLGGFFVLSLYVFLLVRVGIIARKCDRLFPKFLVLGCGLLIVVQALINMAVAVGMMPVTGQPLPLISRGGTSALISCALFGIILSVSRFGAGMGNEEEEEVATEEGEAIEVTDNLGNEKVLSEKPLSVVESITETEI